MRKLILLFCFVITFFQTKAQNSKEQQQLKSLILQAYESVDQPTRQWLAAVSTPGDLDSAYIKSRLKEKLITGGGGDPVAGLFGCMMAFQRLLNKELKEERRAQDHMHRLLLSSKAKKLEMQNQSIDQGMQEARERADHAMDAAVMNLLYGIASGLMQFDLAPFSKVSKEKETVPVYIKKLEGQLQYLKKVGK